MAATWSGIEAGKVQGTVVGPSEAYMTGMYVYMKKMPAFPVKL